MLTTCPRATTLFPYTTLFRSVVIRVNSKEKIFSFDLFSESAVPGQIAWSADGSSIFYAASVVSEKRDRKSTRLNSSHLVISYAVFCLKKKRKTAAKVLTYNAV